MANEVFVWEDVTLSAGGNHRLDVIKELGRPAIGLRMRDPAGTGGTLKLQFNSATRNKKPSQTGPETEVLSWASAGSFPTMSMSGGDGVGDSTATYSGMKIHSIEIISATAGGGGASPAGTADIEVW